MDTVSLRTHRPRRTFAVFYNVLLDLLLTVYLLWLTAEMAVPVFRLFMTKGLPANAAALAPLREVILMAAVPFIAASIANASMKRVWGLKSSAGFWQCTVCAMVSAVSSSTTISS